MTEKQLKHLSLKSPGYETGMKEDIIKRARKKAFEIIEEDSKLSLSKNSLIRNEFMKEVWERIE